MRLPDQTISITGSGATFDSSTFNNAYFSDDQIAASHNPPRPRIRIQPDEPFAADVGAFSHEVNGETQPPESKNNASLFSVYPAACKIARLTATLAS